MSEAKHTPGPWQVAGTRHSGDLKIGPNTRLHMVGPDGDAVSAVFFDMKTGLGLADARLIAAAPDLLEALKALSASLFLPNEKTSPELKTALEMTVAAISKAEGRA